MKRHRLSLLMVAAGASAASAQYTIREIPPPPGPAISALAVSRNGEWIGAVCESNPSRLHRYHSATLARAELTGLSQTNTANILRHGISNDGQALAIRWGNIAYWWHNGALTPLLGTMGCGGQSNPTDMSGDGLTIVGMSPSFTNVLCHSQVWRSQLGGPAIVMPSGGTNNWHVGPPACSADGQTVTWSDAQGPLSYVQSVQGGQTVSGGPRLRAVSPDGLTVAGFAGLDFHTWEWQTGQTVTRFTALSSSSVSHVLDGASLALGTEAGLPWVWTAAQGKVPFTSYAAGLGVNLAGWTNLVVYDMDDAATCFVGRGRLNGQNTNWVILRTCYPDCNGDGALNLGDFGCFQIKFALGNAYADCNGDGMLNLADFGCFQTRFAQGCP